eukprot:8544-Eustigmatos_ZCMA.PRE.1
MLNPSRASLSVSGRGWYFSSDFETTSSYTQLTQNRTSTFPDPSASVLRLELGMTHCQPTTRTRL